MTSSLVPSTYIPVLDAINDAEVKRISDQLGLAIPDSLLKDYTEFVNTSLKSFEDLKDVSEGIPLVKYPRTPGRLPTKDENPDNAWSRIVDIKGANEGMLKGKRIAVKDNIFVAGVPLSNGSKVWDGFVPDFDATIVTRALDAGATIVGTATCENQCYSGNSCTSFKGPVLNPHDRTRSSAGSSSGSAVLVARGACDMAFGGDQGGSIRLPSCWCGVVGLKPTFGLVPCTGSIGMEPSFDHVGPIASTVADLALLLEVIAGYDGGRDSRQSPHVTIPQYSKLIKGSLNGRKLAWVQEGFTSASAGVRSVIESAVEKIKQAGATVDVISIPEHAKAHGIFTALLSSFYESMFHSCGQPLGHNSLYSRPALEHARQFVATRSHDLQPVVKFSAILGEYVRQKNGHQVTALASNQRLTLRKAYDSWLSKYDALLMPTIPFEAPKLPAKDCTLAEFMTSCLSNTSNTAPFNLTGHPALTLNAGFSYPNPDGPVKLPVGLQLIGRHFEEVNLLDLALGIERVV